MVLGGLFKVAKLYIGINYTDSGQILRYKKFLDGEELEVVTTKWHEPVINPISTNYTQSGTEVPKFSKHWGLFDETRRKADLITRKKHSGLDLFGTTGTKVFACLDGTVYKRQWHGGYGNTITIKVDDPKTMWNLKRDYKLQYEAEGEMKKGSKFSKDGNLFLFYAHLHTVEDLKIGVKVKAGDSLGTIGRSGVEAGTRAPHLHFEIFSTYKKPSGIAYCINPAYWVNYKGYAEQSDTEKQQQKDENKRSKIKEYEDKVKLSRS